MNTLVLTYWSFREGLIQTYTLPYLKIITGHFTDSNRLYLVTMEKHHLRLSASEQKQVSEELEAHKIIWIPLHYQKPGLRLIPYFGRKLLSLLITVHRTDLQQIHTFCTPAGALGYLLSILSGKKLILDSFEPHAESMVENGTWSKKSLKYSLLHWFERKQILRASFVIGTTSEIPTYIRQRFNIQLDERKFCVKPACVNLELFQIPSEEEKMQRRLSLGIKEEEVVAVYAGKLGGIYLEEETFSLLRMADQFWNGRFRFLMLTDTPRERIEELAMEAGLSPDKIISQFVDHREVTAYLSAGDFGITPVKSVPTKRYCTPIKDGEYWALGLPVVITKDISDDSSIIKQEGIGAVIETLDDEGYRSSIEKIDRLLKEDQKMLRKKIRAIASEYRSFEIAAGCYRKVYKHEW